MGKSEQRREEPRGLLLAEPREQAHAYGGLGEALDQVDHWMARGKGNVGKLREVGGADSVHHIGRGAPPSAMQDAVEAALEVGAEQEAREFSLV